MNSCRKPTQLLLCRYTNPLKIRQASIKVSDENVFVKYLLASVPISTFGLGTWQIFRRKEKLEHIKYLQDRTSEPVIELPKDMSELEKLEYRRVKVRGKFDHSQEVYLSPRSLMKDGDFDSDSKMGGLVTPPPTRTTIGANVVTPFILSGSGERILVNRGWVPRPQIDPSMRKNGQIEGELELVGIVRHQEGRPPLGGRKSLGKNEFRYRDVDAMSEKLNTEPIFIDADMASSIPGGPIGGQTRVSLRNEHLTYIMTWYALAFLSTLLWLNRFGGAAFNKKLSKVGF